MNSPETASATESRITSITAGFVSSGIDAFSVAELGVITNAMALSSAAKTGFLNSIVTVTIAVSGIV